MIAPSLYAFLRSRGVSLGIAPTPPKADAEELPPLRLHVRAPFGLSDSMWSLMEAHRDELLQFVFELEESAAILQVMQANRIEDAHELARDCVLGGRAGSDGQLWLKEYAEREIERLGLSRYFGPLEIVSIESEEEARAA